MKPSGDHPPAGTVGDWLDARARRGGVAVVFPDSGRTLHWAELHAAARRFAGALTARGASKSDSVAIVAPNGPEAVTALYGTLVGGFRATMINLAAGRDAIAFALEHSEARLAYVHADSRTLFDDANGTAISVVPLDADGDSPLCAVGPGDDALLMYTSGTTGRPKGWSTPTQVCCPAAGRPRLPMT